MLTRVACLPPKPQTQNDIYDGERLCRFNEQEALTTMLGSLTQKVCNEILATKEKCFPIDVILVCIRGYVAYPVNYRNLEEMMQG